MTIDHIAVLKEVVQIRAQQLRSEGVGYLRAISRITSELYDQQEKGKDRPIGDIQPQASGFVAVGTALGKVPWSDLVKVLNKALRATFKGRTQKKAKLEAIRDQVVPWIAEVYKGQKPS